MSRISRWLESMGWREPADASVGESDAPVEMTTGENVVAAISANETNAEESSDSEHTPTLTTLTSLDEAKDFGVESPGFDPYNSGSFEASKSRLQK